MFLEKQLNDMLEELLTSQASGAVTKDQLIHCLDLTLLEIDATQESLNLLQDRAIAHQVAAVCVLPNQLSTFILPSSTHLATVINFPHGTDDLSASLAEVNHAVTLGAEEIDFVLPYNDYLTGNRKLALNQCDAIIKACQKKGIIIKIILETGAFPDLESIYNVSKELIAMGANFIKTSTGKIAQGATLPAVFTILSALKESQGNDCGIKISGGVKKTQQALNFAYLAELMLNKPINSNWFRIGASSLLDELLQNT
ncbi:deoxyribose-phosphate aldolase [Legionella worsleiensis]|uniref:Deoxyribose-phosphate aldolase n=1 Tax=Legionella worsleiensis TaxID=45076 RepID=A0A0W1A6E9_9GAMM|nr:deoxyribose-phosphate aldolase [Legionella worsleiensis]KTD76925.1 2-deoxyribose-5-phosphate aldolase [Legionella worsleiensis]STY33405.1 deoxyribose-phosphate aldolase [Legionella worsleiensis]